MALNVFAYLSRVSAREGMPPICYYATLQYGRDYICSGLKGR